MYVTVHHKITDQNKWEQSSKNMMRIMEENRLPQGLKGLMYLPSKDGGSADCLWEADSVDSLKSFLDRETGAAARNEYFEVNAEQAEGLPGKEELHKVG
jgi:hypothetical protein